MLKAQWKSHKWTIKSSLFKLIHMKIIPGFNQQISRLSIFRMLYVRQIEFPENYLFFNSGRGAIKWLLSQLRFLMGKKLSVGMPCYSCHVVFQSVYESKNEAILLDINPLYFSSTGKLNEQIMNLDVLIWINHFGFKYNSLLKEIRTRYPDLIIVEDCTQVDLRDYLKINKQECNSDYAVFSFNFEKPIIAGGGGLLVTHEERSKKVDTYLYNNYKKLPCEKQSIRKMIRICRQSFPLIYLIFYIQNKLIYEKMIWTFRPDEIPIKSMNRLLRRLFYAQFLHISSKKKSENCTTNYFNNMPELIKKYCFGSLCYYPVTLFTDHNNSICNSADKFMLWKNFIIEYNYFGIDIREEDFPLTFSFISGSIFLPPSFFSNPNNLKIHFPVSMEWSFCRSYLLHMILLYYHNWHLLKWLIQILPEHLLGLSIQHDNRLSNPAILLSRFKPHHWGISLSKQDTQLSGVSEISPLRSTFPK